MPETILETKSKSPYTQIALTYFRQKKFWVSGGLLLAMLIGLTVHAHRHTALGPVAPLTPEAIENLRHSYLTPEAVDGIIKNYGKNYREYIDYSNAADTTNVTFYLFGQIWILFIILAHLKEQMASPRATLVPRYRRPHMIVAAAYTLPLLLLYPLAISFSFHLSPTGVLAVSIAFAALVLWSFYLAKWPLFVIIGMLYLGSFSDPGQRALHAALASNAIPQNLLVITLSLAALAALAYRLMHLREEMPEYSRRVATNQWQTMTTSQSPAPPINFNNPLNRLFYAAAHRELARLAASPPISLWARLQRWQLAGNPTSVSLIFVPIILLQIFGLARLTGSIDIHMCVFELISLPTIVIPQFAVASWRTLDIESLRPLTRAVYLRQRAAFFALQIAQTWFILAATVLTCTVCLHPASLRDPALWLALAASALAQFPLFAICIWVLRYRSPFAIIFYIALSVAVANAAIVISIDTRLSLPAPWLAAIFLTLLLASALLLRDAYHRWLRTDLA